VAEARPLPELGPGSSIFKPNLGTPEEMAGRLRALLEATGTKPGRLSLVLPDNLAKISLVSLPERPPSSRRLDEVLRFKLRRAVPFRLEDAVLAHQVLPGRAPASRCWWRSCCARWWSSTSARSRWPG
jgi:type IV pilus assembly protein PilM